MKLCDGVKINVLPYILTFMSQRNVFIYTKKTYSFPALRTVDQDGTKIQVHSMEYWIRYPVSVPVVSYFLSSGTNIFHVDLT